MKVLQAVAAALVVSGVALTGTITAPQAPAANPGRSSSMTKGELAEALAGLMAAG